MVSLVTDSLDSDELISADQLKLPSSPVNAAAAADYAVPSINDLDFTSPLFDSLPDFETLKDYWICHSPIGERLGESLLEIEDGMDAEAKVEFGLIDAGNVSKGDSESLSLGGVKVEESQVSQNKALEEVNSEEKSTIEASGSLSPTPTIEANLRKVSLDGQVDVSAAADSAKDVEAKAEEKGNEAESDDSSESDSESESSSSEDSSSVATSSSDDDDDVEEEDQFVKRKAELAGQLEEGEIMDEDVEQMVAWSDDEDEVVKGPIRSKNEITVS